MINEPKDYDKGAGMVFISEKQLKDSQDMWLLVGIAAGCLGTIVALLAFITIFVEH